MHSGGDRLEGDRQEQKRRDSDAQRRGQAGRGQAGTEEMGLRRAAEWKRAADILADHPLPSKSDSLPSVHSPHAAGPRPRRGRGGLQTGVRRSSLTSAEDLSSPTLGGL